MGAATVRYAVLDVSAESASAELNKVLGSRLFTHAGRLTRFLRYVVEQVLQDGGVSLKEYSIGIEVYDRPETFDPRREPIVRVEARRLRAKLRDYYAAEGCEDPIEIRLPDRGYVPAIRKRARPGDGVPRIGPSSQARSIAVLPFAAVDKWSERFNRGFSEELINALDQLHGLRVLVWQHGAPSSARTANLSETAAKLHVGATLEAHTRQSKNTFRLSARLISVDDGTLLWSQIYEQAVDNAVQQQQEIASKVAQAIRVRLAAPERSSLQWLPGSALSASA